MTDSEKLGRSAVISGLVSQKQLDAVMDSLLEKRAKSDPPQDSEIAAAMIARGWLTGYQVEQLRTGRTKLTLGPYVVTDWLGQGGMGQVFKAVHPMMGREVAIKVLPQIKSTEDAVNDFRREIRLQAQLDHACLVRAYDAGHDGNVYFLVTEFVDGDDLRRLVRANGPLNMYQAARIISQTAEGLTYAHERGLVHRDIKPGNILVTAEGVAKLTDLGLSGFLYEEDSRLGKIVGTADYLPPEQIRHPGEFLPVGDIYSLGCTLYYAITGKVPFPGGSTKEKVRRHLDETPWHPKRFNAELDNDFVDLIADMMEKDPKRRLQTAKQVASRLEPWALESRQLSAGHQRLRSPWQPPPLPGGQDTATELPRPSPPEDSNSETHSTSRLSGTDQETQTPRPPIPQLYPRPILIRRVIVWPLLIAIPVAMAFGAALTFWFLKP